MSQGVSKLRLEKSDLDCVPDIPVPEGYVLRTFREGDEAGLSRVFVASQLGNETPEKVHALLMEHPCYKPGRVFVIEHAGEVVGTCSAWINLREPDYGYLHMLGVSPEHRGKNLGRILSIAVAGYSLAEGFTRQRLDTDDWREPALRMYLSLNYVPLIADDTHPTRWAAIGEKIGCLDVIGRARDVRAATAP
ncbi:MAG: mycothiol synthase [Candidatus Hydrogenedentes bacterium]|nr:mycothiol synthase [Candidatus Hydrogenedentota bacterium]